MFKAEIFRQCRSTALRKIAVSPFAKSPLVARCRLPFATRRSPFAAFLPVAIRHSLPFFPDLPICRPHDLPETRLGRSLAPRLIPSCIPLSDKLDGS
jgi:hypothetical protein